MCWGGGEVDFFGCGQPSVPGEMQSFAPPALDDGLLEVVGTNGVGHLMATKLGFRYGLPNSAHWTPSRATANFGTPPPGLPDASF